jgi:hypothetical protein
MSNSLVMKILHVLPVVAFAVSCGTAGERLGFSAGTCDAESLASCENAGNECMVCACVDGESVTSPARSRTTCSTNGTVCDGAGKCSWCTKDSDCGVDDACERFTCVDGACDRILAPLWTTATKQVFGDCKLSLCSGGNVNDDSDTWDDNNVCTIDACIGGDPVYYNVPATTECGVGLRCDGYGACVSEP